MYETTLNDKDQTNKYAEACHKELAYELRCHHLTLWKFLETLNKVKKGGDLYMEHHISGDDSAHKLKIYQDIDKRIKKILDGYDAKKSFIEYLRGLAQNFQM